LVSGSQTTIVTMTTRRLREKVTITTDKFCEFIYDDILNVEL